MFYILRCPHKDVLAPALGKGGIPATCLRIAWETLSVMKQGTSKVRIESVLSGLHRDNILANKAALPLFL